MTITMERADADFSTTPHLTNDKGEVLYASLLQLDIEGITTTQVRYCWLNVNNIGDGYFNGLWRQELNEHLSRGGTICYKIIYHPVCPDPSQSVLIERSRERK